MKIYNIQEVTNSQKSLPRVDGVGTVFICDHGIKHTTNWVDTGEGLELRWITEPISLI
jgi:hypothetical protein